MIDANTKILGLIGYPLGHTISPMLHNYSLRQMDLNYVYLPFPLEPEKLEDAVKGFKAINVRGLNVTIPFKSKIIPYLDNIEEAASRIGAVNTIVNDNGVLSGYNTDFIGLTRMIEEDAGFSITNKNAIIVGAGGAARAAGIALLEKGIDEIHLLNRTRDKAEKLVEEWQGYYPSITISAGELSAESYSGYINKVDLIIDTTPRGMSPHEDEPPVIPAEYLNSNMLVVDLVYNPRETCLVKAARKTGAEAIDGMGMLLYQGIESFKIWTGREIDANIWWNLVK